jgi:hypothetical protein
MVETSGPAARSNKTIDDYRNIATKVFRGLNFFSAFTADGRRGASVSSNIFSLMPFTGRLRLIPVRRHIPQPLDNRRHSVNNEINLLFCCINAQAESY